MLIFSARPSPAPTVRRNSCILFLTAFSLFFLSTVGASLAATLYLTESGRLSSNTPKASVRYYVSKRYVLEWQYRLKGNMAGTSYGYSIYAETTAQSDVSAYLEIILRSGQSEKVLARWDRALWGTRGIQHFTGSVGGDQPESKEGDVIVLRIGMSLPSKYSDYGAIWASDEYPSSITVPDIGSLSSVDMQNFRSELSVSQGQLDQVLTQQEETRRRLEDLSSTVERLEFMMEELRDGLIQGRRQSEAAVQPEEEELPAPKARLRFMPALLELPAQKDDLVVCMVKLDEEHNVRDILLDTLKLVGPSGSLKPNTDLCSFVNGNSAFNADLRICFEAQKIGDLFAKNPGKTLFATLELNGEMNDGAPIRGRGVIQIKRREQQP